MALSISDGKILLSWSSLIEVSPWDFPGSAQDAVDADQREWMRDGVWGGSDDARDSWALSVASASTQASACKAEYGLADLRVSAWAGRPRRGAEESWRVECRCELIDPKKLREEARIRLIENWGSDEGVDEMALEDLAYEIFHASNDRKFSPLDAGFEFIERRGGASAEAQWQAMSDSMEIERALALKGDVKKKAQGAPRV